MREAVVYGKGARVAPVPADGPRVGSEPHEAPAVLVYRQHVVRRQPVGAGEQVEKRLGVGGPGHPEQKEPEKRAKHDEGGKDNSRGTQ